MIGRRFGNYEARSLLGEGGMGSVYLAEHPGIGRKVAVKVLRGEFSKSEELLGRFLNEARAANAIRHPNIIEILDSGTTPDGQPFLVMELLEGETLAARLKRLGALPVPVALEFVLQTASAVGAAHKKNIVHRDLKPDNLYIVLDEADPSRERIKVLDFGIAKLQAAAHGDSVKTRTGTLMGTPVYMSPEQCLGTKVVDRRSDVYSLGVILFEMLCGRPPFSSEGFGELVHMHMNVAPPAPRTLVPALPAELEDIVLRTLAKAPEARYPSMADLQDAVKLAALRASLEVRAPASLESATTSGTVRAFATAPTTASARETTFTEATGQRPQGTAPPGRGRRAVALGLVAVALAGGLALRGFREAEPTVPEPPVASPVSAPAPAPVAAHPAPAVEPRTVRVRIESRPPGARVVRTEDGVLLGVTPYQTEVESAPRSLGIRVEKQGYAPVSKEFFLDRNWDEVVPLDKVRAARPARAARRAAEEPAKL